MIICVITSYYYKVVVGLETQFCTLLDVWGGWDLGCWLLTRRLCTTRIGGSKYRGPWSMTKFFRLDHTNFWVSIKQTTIETLNPGSIAKIYTTDVDDEEHFDGFCLCFRPQILRIVRVDIRAFTLDVCFIKHEAHCSMTRKTKRGLGDRLLGVCQQVKMDDEGTTFEKYLNNNLTVILDDKTGHSTSCPEANLLPCTQHFKLNALSNGSKTGDKVFAADSVFTKAYWGLQQSPNEEVFANRLAHFCQKWPNTGVYLAKHTEAGMSGRLSDWHTLGLQTMGMKSNNMSEIENSLSHCTSARPSKNVTEAGSWSITRPGEGSSLVHRSDGQKSRPTTHWWSLEEMQRNKRTSVCKCECDRRYDLHIHEDHWNWRESARH